MGNVVALHILRGSLPLIGGFAALYSRKGAWLHRNAGILFVYRVRKGRDFSHT